MLTAVSLVAAAAAGIALVLLFQWRRARREAAAATAAVARLEALAAALPLGYVAWEPDGAAVPSDAAHRLLGPTPPDQPADALAVADRPALRDAVGQLRETGAGFTLVAATADGTRQLELTGRRGIDPTGAATVDVVWLSDATETIWQATALAEAEEMQAELCAMLDLMPEPAWLRRSDLRLGWVNTAYTAAVDATLDRVVRDQVELAAAAFDDGGRALAARAQAAGEPQSETRHVVIGGQRRLVTFIEAPMPGGGRSVPVVGYAQDITRVEELKRELQRHIATEAEVLGQLKSAIAVFGANQRLVFFNQAYAQLWALDEAWLETQPTLGEVLEDLRERRRLPEHANFPAFKAAQLDLFTRLIEPSEDLSHLPDGRTLRSMTLPHSAGGLMFVLEDVTSTLQLEASYNTLVAVQRESLDNLVEGIAVFGGDGRLRLSNRAFAAQWGLAADELSPGTHLVEILDRIRDRLVVEGDWAATRAAMMGALDRAESRMLLARRDGSVLEFMTVALPDGGVLYSFHDVTGTAQVERALRASNEALEAADRLKSEFVANVSYQLRTPLNAIMGFAEILHARYFGPLNPRQVEYTQNIVNASQRLLSLVNDLLDLATIEAGYMELERRPVDIAGLLRGVHELARDWAGKQSLAIEVDCPSGIGRFVADEKRLRQALYNLVSNGIRFTPKGGRITLAARRTPEAVILSVSDTGIGIPEAEQLRVLGRFERAHPTGETGGVGLGLALVKSFVEMHGGRIELESRPDEGTTVRCVFPLEAATAEAPRAVAQG